MKELLENLNFEIRLDAYESHINRIRIRAEYKDHNGEVDFISSIHIDSGDDEITPVQRPRVWLEYKVAQHII